MYVNYKENPFYILHRSLEDTRDVILEKADDMCFDEPEREDVIEQAKGILLNPQRRIRAELGWLPEVSTAIIEAKIQAGFRFAESDTWGLNPLARLNILLANMEEYSGKVLADCILKLDELYATININELWQLLNKERKRAGFPAIQEPELLKEPWQEMQAEIKHGIQACVSKLSNDEYIRVSGMVAAEAATKGKFGIILQDYIDSYWLAQRQLYEQLCEYFHTKKEALSTEGVPINEMRIKVPEMGRLVKPINLYNQTMGIEDTPGAVVVNYGIDVYDAANDIESGEAARSLFKLIKEAYAYNPRALEIAEDILYNLERALSRINTNSSSGATSSSSSSSSNYPSSSSSSSSNYPSSSTSSSSSYPSSSSSSSSSNRRPVGLSHSSSSSSSSKSNDSDDGAGCLGCLGILIVAGIGGAVAGPFGFILAIGVAIWMFSD